MISAPILDNLILLLYKDGTEEQRRQAIHHLQTSAEAADAMDHLLDLKFQLDRSALRPKEKTTQHILFTARWK